MAFHGSQWLVLALLGACSRAEAPSKPRFVTRDYELWVLPTTDENRYTVKSLDGRVLADRIDEDRLRREFSYLHNRLHPEYKNTYDRVGD